MDNTLFTEERQRTKKQYEQYFFYLDSREHRAFLRTIATHITGEKILDLGCGTAGLFEELLITRKKSEQLTLIGIEQSEVIAQKARDKSIPHTTIINAPVCSFDFPQESFDSIIMVSILHELVSSHKLPIIAQLFACLWQALKPGGKLIIHDGFRNDTIVANLQIHNYDKRILLDSFREARPDAYFYPYGAGFVSSLTHIFDFVHKCYYLENWEHEVKEYYYPMSLEAYSLMFGALGCTTLTVKMYPETEHVHEIKKDFSITSLLGAPLELADCNCLLVAQKNGKT
ncbi:MAG: class I SAM-dependent methyltransferase [Candidatus Roizmanbacteria bacterium]|nr:class I SAM-dependent methyltransferase [Candidatus Roizmanbacteria bacterium]